MDLSLLRNFSQEEKVALLKLLVKIAYSDGKLSIEEKSSIKEYVINNSLKCNGRFMKNALVEDMDSILSEFDSRTNLERVKTMSWAFAKKHGIGSNLKDSPLNAIDEAVKHRRKDMKFCAKRYIQPSKEFSFLWGKEDINPETNLVLAVTLTLSYT